jgi:ribosome silencing factor RsfS/YbeB/iojap
MTTETAAKKDVQKLQRAIVDGLEDVKAQDIVVFNTADISPLFERVIVASGTSNRQTKALASSVRSAVQDAGFDKPRIEGEDNGEWIIVDCGAAVCHIMQPVIRQYYRLEEIWGAKPVRLKTAAEKAAEAREADRIRQLLHELRTPVTAVQGYAEVIQQQLFGPAPHEYRALAAAIAADAAHILAGFEELDRLARLETGALGIEPGEADLAALAQRILDQIAPVLETRSAGIKLDTAPHASLLVPCDAEDAETLMWRLLASIGAACGEGEQLAAQLAPVIGQGRALARLACTLPAELAREEDLFAATIRPARGTINAGLFGAGFALRLARAEARAAGGTLLREGDALVLTLPLLTGSDALPSPASGRAG